MVSSVYVFSRSILYIFSGVVIFFVAVVYTMVLSTTKRTASIQSIVNQNQEGGSKKAGLPGTTTRDHNFQAAMKVHQTRNTLPKLGVVFGLKHTVNPNVSQSRPAWSTYTPNTYY